MTVDIILVNQRALANHQICGQHPLTGVNVFYLMILTDIILVNQPNDPRSRKNVKINAFLAWDPKHLRNEFFQDQKRAVCLFRPINE